MIEKIFSLCTQNISSVFWCTLLFFSDTETKLRRFGPTNQIVDDSDSDDAEFGQWLQPHSKFDQEFGFP